ncbi:MULTISPECIES: hypothetical protein [unclassified Ruegeria]|uniref:hypothetical protein n=1 Tax=unclassified Ruegeria TaxID=2625375 RepID=UPI001487A036|nr:MULTISPECIES: hypothetical protein [unclassified Ruegeria]
MKQLLISSCLSVAMALPAAAQEQDGPSLMERGAELFLEGLRQEMEPALEDLLGLADQFGPAMQSFLMEMGPALAELAAQIEDWSAYELPEMLPNGDIIIRKKPPQDEPDLPIPDPETGITDI